MKNEHLTRENIKILLSGISYQSLPSGWKCGNFLVEIVWPQHNTWYIFVYGAGSFVGKFWSRRLRNRIQMGNFVKGNFQEGVKCRRGIRIRRLLF